MKAFRLLQSCLIVVGCVTATFAVHPTGSVDGVEFFEKQVRPILVERCFECHAEEEKGGLRLDSGEALVRGGDSGSVIGSTPEDSLLIQAIRYGEDFQMPPKSKLPETEIAKLTKWVAMGAPYPKSSSLLSVDSFASLFEQRKKHWSFQPIEKPPLPRTANLHGLTTAVDRFVLARIESESLEPAKQADRATLLRRLSFDLLGLPPSPSELTRFLSDPRPTKLVFAEVVDQFLARPEFGERWARHWLDLVRYTETAGHVQDRERENAWQYRDYAIRAFNGDLPFDQFIIEHLAGDLIEPRSEPGVANAGMAATGYLWFHEMHFKPVDPNAQRADQVDAQIDVTSKAFLGLTVACARCHDHKFDAISQRDYYALAGIFHSTIESSAPLTPLPNSMSDKALRLVRQKRKEIEQLTEKGIKEAAADRRQKTDQVPPISETVFSPSIKAKLKQVRAEIADVVPEFALWAPAASDSTGRDAHLHIRGNHKRVGAKVPRGYLSAFDTMDATADLGEESGRLYLASRIASSSNPLTPRVIVNRIWQHLFGEGLVRTPSNFGTTGELPTHPLLLDYLANQLLAHDWSLKDVIREIVLSDTYQRTSVTSDEAQVRDPENRFLQHQNVRRLEAEAIRDAMLAVAHTLDGTRFGPSVPPYLSANTTSNKRSHIPKAGPLDGAGRRSIYIKVRRNFLNPLLATFDFPDQSISVAKRNETLVPSQALAMLNSPFVHQQAQRWAEFELRQTRSVEQRIREMYLSGVGRAPTANELTLLLQQINRLRAEGAEEILVWKEIAHILFSLNDFLFLK